VPVVASSGAAELGLGVRAALAGEVVGSILEVFRHAVYVQTPGGVFALASRQVPSGPLHLRCDLSLERLRRGDQVTVTGGWLQSGDQRLSIEGASVWQGTLPDVARLERGLDIAERALTEVAHRSALRGPGSPFAGRWHQAVDHVEGGDLAGAAAVLGGLGPGLTPSGDDALAGMLVAARARWPAWAEASLVQVAAAVDTHQISRGFLRWAARGQSICPVHRLLAAVAARDRRLAERTLPELLAFGHTSGADLALGLQVGLGLLPGRPPGWRPARRPELGRVLESGATS
jgi:Protein of unknown function (DUF2877)